MSTSLDHGRTGLPLAHRSDRITYRLPTEAGVKVISAGGGTVCFGGLYNREKTEASCFDCGSRWDGKSTAQWEAFQLIRLPHTIPRGM